VSPMLATVSNSFADWSASLVINPSIPAALSVVLGNVVDLNIEGGAKFQLVPPARPEADTHIILNLVSGSGHDNQVVARDIMHGCAISYLIARELSLFLHGNPESYTISKNGANTGSVPEINHWHIYGFKDRTQKLDTWNKNVSRFLRTSS